MGVVQRVPDQNVDIEVIVVGAGIGGLVTVHELRQQGFEVLGLEKGADVGGVWYHNSYPGARVDLESMHYCYFDPELYEQWTWSERYAAQPELLDYLNFAADHWDVRQFFRFRTTVTSASWDDASSCWIVQTDDGNSTRCRYLVMATGPLSAARDIRLPGVDEFEGRVLLTAHWPKEENVDLAGLRVGVVGTSATGVQLIPWLARQSAHLHVFQRTANYVVPAQNRPLEADEVASLKSRRTETRRAMLAHPGGTDMPSFAGKAGDFTRDEQLALLEERWAYGAHSMTALFTDQGTDEAVNEMVAEFVRDKVAQRVDDPEVAEMLTPRSYPVGTRRLGVDIDYYETFNRDNVTLVDIRRTPILNVLPGGVRTDDGDIELDVLILATGFEALTGALFRANLTGVGGKSLTEHWQRGPTSYMGLMTRDFPNLLTVTGPGSPAVLANMFAGSEHHAEWIASFLAFVRERGYRRFEPSEPAQHGWDDEVQRAASPLIRYRVPNYMVHVNDDGSRVFIPYPGGFNRYIELASAIAESDYASIEFA